MLLTRMEYLHPAERAERVYAIMLGLVDIYNHDPAAIERVLKHDGSFAKGKCIYDTATGDT